MDAGRFFDSAVETVGGAYETAKNSVFGTAESTATAEAAEDSGETGGEGAEIPGSSTVAKIPLGHRLLPKITGPKTEILGGRFEIECVFDLTADGTIELSHGEEKKARAGSKNEIGIGVVPDGFLLEFGKKWVNEKGLKILNWNSVITEANMGLKATIKGFDEVELAYEAEVNIGPGTAKFKASLISFDAKKGERKIGRLEFAGSTPLKLGKVKVTDGIEVDLQLSVSFGAEAKPDWPVIFQKDVAPKLEAIGIESVSVAALFVAAIGVPVVAIKELVDSDDINNAGKKWDELTDVLVEGHRLGFTGAAAPSDSRMLQTYNPAFAKFTQQVKSIMQNNAGSSEDVVKQKLAGAAAQEFEKQKDDIESQMQETARAAIWAAYGEAYRDRTYDLCTVWTQLHGGNLPKQTELDAFMKYSKTPPMISKTR